MELFKKDQVWLFAGKTMEDAHGIVLTKSGALYKYNNHKRKPKAVEDLLSMFYGDYRIDFKKQLFYFTRCRYAYHVTTITETDLILEREAKPFTKEFLEYDKTFPKSFVFKRLEKKVTLRILEDDNGDGDVQTWLEGKIQIN